jgi:hypothetical protein
VSGTHDALQTPAPLRPAPPRPSPPLRVAALLRSDPPQLQQQSCARDNCFERSIASSTFCAIVACDSQRVQRQFEVQQTAAACVNRWRQRRLTSETVTLT